MVLRCRKWKFVPKSVTQCEARRYLESILRVEIQSATPNFAAEISSALQKDDWVARQEAGESVAVRERGEHKKSVACDSLQRIDLIAPVAFAKFQLVPGM